MSSRTTLAVLIVSLLIVSTSAAVWAFSAPSLGNYVWVDIDGDGIQDSGEPGLNGVTVELWTDTSGWADTRQTDNGGYYKFVWRGNQFKVRFTLPDGYQFTAANQDNDDALDSDGDPETGETEVFTVVNGDPDYTRDAGLWAPSSIGDYVWEDSNGDGVQDTDENGIGGVTVSLEGDLDGDRNPDVSLQTTTDADGYYSFGNLKVGTYNVTVDTTTLPGGLVPSPGTANTVEVALGFAENREDVDFGYTPGSPAIDLTKSASPTEIDPGAEVTYTYVVTNTGDEALQNVTIVDDAATPTDTSDDFVVGTIASLDVGQSQTLTATVTIDETGQVSTDTYPADGEPVPTVPIVNTAVATGTGQYSGQEVTATDSATVNLNLPPVDPPEPAIALTKTADPTEIESGENVTYTYVVENVGEDDLENVTIVDDNATPGDTSDDFTVATINSLAVGESKTVFVIRTLSVTPDDPTQPYSETLTNIAVATGTGVQSDTEVSDSDSATVEVTVEPERIIEIDIKPGSNPNAVNPNANGVVPVAILTNDTFDAHDVIPESVVFEGASPIRWTYEDALVSPEYPDGPVPPSDGDIDLILFFNRSDLDLPRGTTTATLTGTLVTGETFSATDSIKIPGGPPRR